MPLDIRGLEDILSPDQISRNPQDLLEYGNDWLKQWKGKANAVLFPKSAKEVSQIVHWARKRKRKLTPSGGRTGLSGGAVALKQELAVSFDKMNRILDFNPWDQTVCAEAGCVTQTLQEFAKSQGLFFPISFASQGSSQIGGNIATNAGGAHVLRYGTMRQRVLGLELVTGSGDILNLGKGLVKNAVGYSLKDLFIGSEGTLGFVTKAILSLAAPPDKPQALLMAVEKLESLLDLFKEFKEKTQPLAFEFWTDSALQHVLSHGALEFPLSQSSPFYILAEIEERDSEKALSVFEKALERGIVRDGLLSQSSAQSKSLWSLRENISEAISHRSPYKNDISVRISQMADFLKDLDKLLAEHYPDFEHIVFGHLGDGNLHINILKPEAWEKESFIKKCERVNDILFGLVEKYQGAVSAEHGVGLLKKPYLQHSLSPEELALMKGVKRLFDPDNILNPGKIFDL